MISPKPFKILDTTLRDGSYAVNFSFSGNDTAVICKELESCGFEYIEIGHGVGLNGSAKHGQALVSDEEYMKAALRSLSTAKYGMFCIPGIAQLDHLELAIDHNMGFIRIGTDATDVEKSEPFIKRAKEAGMFVASNFMKSYALDPVSFAEKVKIAESYGSDLVYVVDSAGGMFPDQIRNYYEKIRMESQVPLGFHGHNNLHLAIANSLEALRVGYEFVDTSLQGLGRSAGNAITEILVGVLQKMGIDTGIDFLKVLEIGENYIAPLMNVKGIPSIDTVTGFADFHSSYMGLIHKYAAKYSVDPALLIIEITKIDKTSINENQLEQVAQGLQREDGIFMGRYKFNRYFGSEQTI